MSSDNNRGVDVSETNCCSSQTAGGNVRGASLVEYALLVALIAVLTITALRIVGTTVSSQYSVAAETLAGDPPL